jgi:hypothetical protein
MTMDVPDALGVIDSYVNLDIIETRKYKFGASQELIDTVSRKVDDATKAADLQVTTLSYGGPLCEHHKNQDNGREETRASRYSA